MTVHLIVKFSSHLIVFKFLPIWQVDAEKGLSTKPANNKHKRWKREGRDKSYELQGGKQVLNEESRPNAIMM